MFVFCKYVYGQYELCLFIEYIFYCVNVGKYDFELLLKYLVEEIIFLELKIKYEWDMEFIYFGVM